MSKPKLLTDIENKINKDSIVNDITTGGADKVASAETVKILNNCKADKPVVIGMHNGIKLIGEIESYAVNNGFHLEVMLHNLYLKYGSRLSNAFILVGKYVNETGIIGKMQILSNYNASSSYYLKIQITDTGKIYAISTDYMGYCNWTILNKTDNVIIYDNPSVVSSIDGNVIWDSELNKTNIATSTDLEQKADEQWMYDDWKIESDLPTVYPNKSIAYFFTSVAWNNGKIATSSVIKTIKHNGFIIKQESFRSDGSPLYYRMIDTGTGQWGDWQTIATTDKIDTLWSGSVSTNGATITIPNDISKYKKLLFTVKKTNDWDCVCAVYPKNADKFYWGEYGYINNPFGYLEFAGGATFLAFQIIPTGCEVIKVVGVYN